jgi:hypothetical protein
MMRRIDLNQQISDVSLAYFMGRPPRRMRLPLSDGQANLARSSCAVASG